MHYYFKVDWSKVKFVFCDERLVPFDDADSTYGVYKKSDIFKLEVMRFRIHKFDF